MTLRNQIKDQLKTAMRNKDQIAISTIRLILAALKDRDIAAREKGNIDGIAEQDILSMLQGMVKQRRESIKLYEQGGRIELAEREGAEIALIETFLPQQMNDEDTLKAVHAVIDAVGAAGIRDMGKVMTELRTRHAGQMDFGKASGLVKEALA